MQGGTSSESSHPLQNTHFFGSKDQQNLLSLHIYILYIFFFPLLPPTLLDFQSHRVQGDVSCGAG